MKQAVQIGGLAIGVFVCCSFAAAATEISLHERVVSRSSVVRMGDVAKIVDSDPQRVQILARLPLMPAPAPGTQRYLRQREIQDLLAAHGEGIGQLRFAGAAQVAVVAADAGKTPDSGQSADARQETNSDATSAINDRLSMLSAERRVRKAAPSLTPEQADQLRGLCRQLIVDQLTASAGNAGAWRVVCEVPDRLLAELQTATTAPKCTGGNEPWTGRQRFVISFGTPRGTEQVSVCAEVALATPVVVALRPIARGEVITAAHVALQTIEFAPRGNAARAPASDVEKLIGMEAEQAIRAGDIVYSDQVRAPLLVRRGEIINVTSQGGAIRVRTTARARQNGARGELVQVETLETRERFDVRVVGTREAAVFAAAPPSLPPRQQMTDTALRVKGE